MRWPFSHITSKIAENMLQSKLRFIIPIILIGVGKIYGSLWVYYRSFQNGIFSTPWMNLWNTVRPSWLYLFVAWDTSWYVSIAETFSFTLDRTFFPGYIIVVRLIGIIMWNYWLSAFIISLAFGFASIFMFQIIAEHYMSRVEALASTLVMAFFPHIFLFTTVAYSESLFLFSVLACWYFNLKKKNLPKILFALVTTLTKIYGIIIIVPMLLDAIVHRRWKEALLTSIPILLIMAIVLPFVNREIVNRFILEFNAATWSVSRVTIGNFWFRDYILPVFTSASPMSFFHFFHAYALAFIVLIGYLVFSSTKTDWRLGVYSTIMFIAIILFGYSNGLVRYTSFIFPIWLNIKIRNPVIIISILILFYIHSLILWHQFLWAPYPM